MDVYVVQQNPSRESPLGLWRKTTEDELPQLPKGAVFAIADKMGKLADAREVIETGPSFRHQPAGFPLHVTFCPAGYVLRQIDRVIIPKSQLKKGEYYMEAREGPVEGEIRTVDIQLLRME